MKCQIMMLIMKICKKLEIAEVKEALEDYLKKVNLKQDVVENHDENYFEKYFKP